MNKPVFRISLIVTAIFIIALLVYQYAFRTSLTSDVSGQIKAYFIDSPDSFKGRFGSAVIHSELSLPRFYKNRDYKPAWSNDQGLSPHINKLIFAIGVADRESLQPSDYHLDELEQRFKDMSGQIERKSPVSPNRLAEFDLIATDAYLTYASHLLAGRLNSETIDPEWHIDPPEMDIAEHLEIALSSGSIEASLKDLLPRHTCFGGLRSIYSRYRYLQIQGGWPTIDEGAAIKPGNRDARIPLLRKRLEITGEYANIDVTTPDVYDTSLVKSIVTFQKNHGLDADGVIGNSTIQELNVSVDDRIKQVEVNMERWRWLPRDLGPRYIMVNIANYELKVVENSQAISTMRVIVGKEARQTPVLYGLMTYLVLNPYWYVPPTIIKEDLLPGLKSNPNYLSKKGINLYRGYGDNAVPVNPATVNWADIDPEKLPYVFRQDPGPKNALGRIKFMFPNKHFIYLHDTPSRSLFNRTERNFSSGCIRIERPIDMALYLLKNNPEWNYEAIMKAFESEDETRVNLPEPISVYILYCTTWMDENGEYQFRKDLYERDERVAHALKRELPDA